MRVRQSDGSWVASADGGWLPPGGNVFVAAAVKAIDNPLT